MAVRHGYGKIAGTDALVFAYDTGDTRNSYKGEPTTNYLSAGLNGVTAFTVDAWNGTTLTEVGTSVFGTPIFRYVTAGTNYTYTNDNALDDDLATLSQQTVTFSLYIRRIEGPATCRIRIYDNNSGYTYQTRSVTTQFTRIEMTKIIGTSPTRMFVMLDNTGGGTYEFHSTQLELNSKATPFINGTRSSTQGLLDLTGNSTIDLANVSFDSNATMTWDGTDDFLSGAESINYPVSWTDAYTLECMVYVPSSAVWTNSFFSSLIMKGSYQGSHGLVRSNTDNQIGMWARGDNGAVAAYTSIVRDVWTHIVGVWTGDRTEIYINGVLESFSGTARTGIPDGGAWRIGRASAASGNTGNTFDGEIPIVKFYNRALTAAEVRNNYNQYKGRFNI